MKLTVPHSITHAIKDADMARFAELARKVKERERERKRLEKIAKLRADNRQDLEKFAAFAFEWRDAFAETEECKRIWELIGPDDRLTIFGARFWKGEPTDDRHCWATLSLDGWHPNRLGAPPFWYEERYNTSHGSSSPEELSGTAEDPQRLVDKVHPDFLDQLHRHLNGDDAWKYVLQQVQSIAKRF